MMVMMITMMLMTTMTMTTMMTMTSPPAPQALIAVLKILRNVGAAERPPSPSPSPSAAAAADVLASELALFQQLCGFVQHLEQTRLDADDADADDLTLVTLLVQSLANWIKTMPGVCAWRWRRRMNAEAKAAGDHGRGFHFISYNFSLNLCIIDSTI